MRDIVIFTRQFSTMINAGLPLVQALDILAKQSENKALQGRHEAGRVRRRVGQHASPTRCASIPKAFTELYVNMVAAGEAGGILDTILMRLAMFMEKNDALVRKVKGAMIYPGVIMSVAVIAITVLLLFVIPTFQKHVRDGRTWRCRCRRASSSACREFLQGYWWADRRRRSSACVLRAQAVLRDAERQARRSTGCMLKVPVLGDVLRKSAVSRFTRTLGTLISSGVSILDGLEITAKTAGNRVIQDAIMESRASIAGGETIAAPLQKSQVFPPMVISMIAVGEQTGGLDEMLIEDRRLLR